MNLEKIIVYGIMMNIALGIISIFSAYQMVSDFNRLEPSIAGTSTEDDPQALDKLMDNNAIKKTPGMHILQLYFDITNKDGTYNTKVGKVSQNVINEDVYTNNPGNIFSFGIETWIRISMWIQLVSSIFTLVFLPQLYIMVEGISLGGAFWGLGFAIGIYYIVITVLMILAIYNKVVNRT